jgi:hypothetical protein
VGEAFIPVDEAGIIKTLCLHRLLLLSLTVLATVEAEVVDGVVEEDGEGTDEDEIDQVVIFRASLLDDID